MQIHNFVRLTAVEDKGDLLSRALRDVTLATRAEEGCLEIRICRSTVDPKDFFIYTQWADEAALEYHQTLRHVSDFRDRAYAYIAHMDLVRTEPVDA